MMQKETDNATQGSSFNPYTWIGGALLLLVLGITTGIYWEKNMTVDRVYVSGHHFVSEEEVLDRIEIPRDVHPDSIRFGDIIGRVEQIPYVRQASINVEPSGNLTIEIAERQPIALLKKGNQEVFVDQEGIRLPVHLEKSVNVPLLYGFDTEPMQDTLTSEAFLSTVDFLKRLKNDPSYDATISEVGWSQEEGVVALTQENGVKLIFGDSDFEPRLRNWKAFYTEIIRTKGIEKMRAIDLRFKGQIVTREQ